MTHVQPSRAALASQALAALTGASLYVAGSVLAALVAPELGGVPLLLPIALALVFRERLGARGAGALMFGALASGLVSGLAVLAGMPDTVVVSHWRCGTGFIGLLMALPVFAAATMAMSAAVSWVLGTWLGRLRMLAVLLPIPLIIASVLASGLATQRSVGRPAPEDWTQTLTKLGELAPEKAECKRLTPKEGYDPNECAYPAQTQLGIAFSRVCRDPSPDAELPQKEYCHLRVGDEASNYRTLLGSRSSDQPISFWGRADSPFLVLKHGETVAGAINLRTQQPTDITVRAVASQVQVTGVFLPSLVTTLAFGGLAFAAGITSLLRRRKNQSYSDAVLNSAGGLQLPDGRMILLPNSAALPEPGPVHYRGTLPESDDYRNVPVPDLEVRPGTVAEQLDRSIARETLLHLAAAAALCLGLLPFAMALLSGLVR